MRLSPFYANKWLFESLEVILENELSWMTGFSVLTYYQPRRSENISSEETLRALL